MVQVREFGVGLGLKYVLFQEAQRPEIPTVHQVGQKPAIFSISASMRSFLSSSCTTEQLCC